MEELRDCVNCFYFDFVCHRPYCSYHFLILYSQTDVVCDEYFSIRETIGLIEKEKERRKTISSEDVKSSNFKDTKGENNGTSKR